MSVFDKVKKQATDVVHKHGDKIQHGLDKAARTADEKTHGKYSEKIQKGVSKAKEGLDKLDDKGGPDSSGPDTTGR